MAAAGAVLLLGTTGCDSIREYSVNSYQGVLPMQDSRLSRGLTAGPAAPAPKAPETTTAPAPAPATKTAPST